MPGNIETELVAGAQVKAAEQDIERREGNPGVRHLSNAPSHTSCLEQQEKHDDRRDQLGANEIPCEEDLATLHRVPDHIPLKLFTIAFVELCERFSYYGTIIVAALTVSQYTNFIQQPRPPGSRTGAAMNHVDQAGALGMGQRASTGITMFNQFWQYLMPLFGAWVADKYWGRYKTIVWALAVDIIGHLVLIMAAIPPVITKPPANSLTALIVGILIIGFGTGGFKPNISPLIVEQLNTDHLRVRTLPKTGERVIVDPAATISRVYNWFYLFINIGALVGQVSMVYAEKYGGFYLSFALPTVMLCLCPLVMWWGRTRYKRRAPTGSVLGKAMKTFVLANRRRWHANPVRTWRHLHDGTFWDSVKPSKFDQGTKPAWMTFDDAWVDELRRGFAACSVFLWYPIYWLTYNQLNNNLISQASTMKLNGLPNDLMANLDPLALIILIPIFDIVVYPTLRRFHIRTTPIRKITAGFFTGAAAMAWAAIVQSRIYASPPSSINVWAQSGSYILIAVSEILAAVTSLEYAYSKAPKSMRSLVQAVALFMAAIAAALGEAFVGLVEDPLLVWNYGVMSVLAGVAGCIFWWGYRGLDEEEDSLNELPEGRLNVGLDAGERERRVS